MGIKPTEVLGIGDSDADSDLIRSVGFGVAVANATPLLKSLADYVTEKPYGNGFAETASLILKGGFKPKIGRKVENQQPLG
jgi:hydroxymethylpyrimidine pyrophosphatase-like HAD family hydrolase